MNYDYLIVGSGFYGAICAHELTKKGYNVVVIEKRNHIGGNCYTRKQDDIHIHEYGPHIFHTSNKEVWDWINQFAEFNHFRLNPIANYNGQLYSLPFNMWTFKQLWGVNTPEAAKKIIEEQSSHIGEPRNLEEQAIKLVGRDVYEVLIKGYTEKQWKKPCTELPKEIIKRLPVRFTFDSNYFNDRYQGIPIGGYTQIFEKLLDGIKVIKDVDFFGDKTYWENQAEKIIYTGPIDKYFNYSLGHLEYKTTSFEHSMHSGNYQGCAVMNFTKYSTKYTRIIEHKHFEFQDLDYTWITEEYPKEYIPEQTEPMYPVNDAANNHIYKHYKELADAIPNIHFGGRLAEYKYYDMHQVIESALNFIKTI